MHDEEAGRPLAWIPVEGRGSLPFALVHGESLVAAASWAAGEAGCELVEAFVGQAEVRRLGRTLVLHDPLCPLTPPDFLRAALEQAGTTGRVVVGYRPVVDTVKQVRAEHLGATVDRDRLVCVTSPVVLPANLLQEAGELALGDFATLYATLCERVPVDLLEAPPAGRRITDPDELEVLMALSRS